MSWLYSMDSYTFLSHWCVDDVLFKHIHVFVACRLDCSNMICLDMNPSAFKKHKLAQNIGKIWSINPGINKHVHFTFFLA